MRLKKLLIGALCVCMTMGVASSVNSFDTYAKTKKGVYFQMKKGTMTIYGKGDMPSNMTFKNNKKIKKVVVKKGVKSISDSAFAGCKNIKSISLPTGLEKIGSHAFSLAKVEKITIPKTTKIMGTYAFGGCNNLKYVKMPGIIKVDEESVDDECAVTFFPKVETVEFTTKLSLKTCKYIRTENYIVSEKDKKYASGNGVIYAKKTGQVSVLPAREVVEVPEGCTSFSIRTILYGEYLGDDDWFIPQKGIEEIVLPKSLTTLEQEGFTDMMLEQFSFIGLKKITLKSDNVGQDGITFFTTKLPFVFVNTGKGSGTLEVGQGVDFWDNYYGRN